MSGKPPSRDPTPPSQGGETARGGLSRRRFLRGLGTATVLAAVGLPELIRYRDEAEAAPPSRSAPAPRHRWAMAIDLRRCDGCRKCTEACQKTHYLPKEQTWIKVYEMRDASGGTFYMPRLCMQCDNPPCLRVCPVGATFQNDEGVVLVDQNRCIGCRMCMAACPYEARYFNWTTPPPAPRLPTPPMPEFPVPQKKGTVGKCVFCVHYLAHGQLPACVAGCPMQAIYVGDLVDDVATNGGEAVKFSTFLRDNDAVRFRDELGTGPRVYYILGHGQNLGY
jgi:molybdopterin-containing oxidoreductase family iron-sulfur binding subunit